MILATANWVRACENSGAFAASRTQQSRKPPPVSRTPAITWPVTSVCLQHCGHIPVVMTTGPNVQFQWLEVCWQLERISIGRRDEVQTYHERSEAGISQLYALVGSSFFGVTGLLACHKWLWMVIASTLAESFSRYVAELFPVRNCICKGPRSSSWWQTSGLSRPAYWSLQCLWAVGVQGELRESRNRIRKLLASDFSISFRITNKSKTTMKALRRSAEDMERSHGY